MQVKEKTPVHTLPKWSLPDTPWLFVWSGAILLLFAIALLAPVYLEQLRIPVAAVALGVGFRLVVEGIKSIADARVLPSRSQAEGILGDRIQEAVSESFREPYRPGMAMTSGSWPLSSNPRPWTSEPGIETDFRTSVFRTLAEQVESQFEKERQATRDLEREAQNKEPRRGDKPPE